MRKPFRAAAALLGLLAASITAHAADMPVPPPPVLQPVYVPPPFTWTGFYLGANIGGAWTQRTYTDSIFGLTFNDGSGGGRFIGGGQFGVNYQVGPFVVGAEAEFDWAMNSNNGGNGVLTPVGIVQLTSNDTWISTLAGRFGIAMNRWLVYGKAGAGWVGNSGFTLTNATTGAAVTGSGTNIAVGWLAGAGVEWAAFNNWTVKLEYDYLGLGGTNLAIPGTAPFLAFDLFSTNNRNIQMLKVGFNYLFNCDY